MCMYGGFDSLARDEAACESMRANITDYARLPLNDKIGLDIQALYMKYYQSVLERDERDLLNSFTQTLGKHWPAEDLKLARPLLHTGTLTSRAAHTYFVLWGLSRDPRQQRAPVPDESNASDDNGFTVIPTGCTLQAIGDVLESNLSSVSNHRMIQVDGSETLRLTLSSGRPNHFLNIIPYDSTFWRRYDLVDSYCLLSPKLLPACIFGVQYWIRAHGWGDETTEVDPQRQMSNYTVAVLVIAYLQEPEARRLPVLHKQALLDTAVQLQAASRPTQEAKCEPGTQTDLPVCSQLGYVSPKGRDAPYFDVRQAHGGYSAIFPKGLPTQTLEDAQGSQSSDVLHPHDVDLFLPETGSAAELGQVFVGCLLWICGLFKPPGVGGEIARVVDVRSGGSRSYASTDPPQWVGLTCPIVDPRDTGRRLSAHLQNRSLYALQAELSNLIQVLSETEANCNFFTLADPDRKSSHPEEWDHRPKPTFDGPTCDPSSLADPDRKTACSGGSYDAQPVNSSEKPLVEDAHCDSFAHGDLDRETGHQMEWHDDQPTRSSEGSAMYDPVRDCVAQTNATSPSTEWQDCQPAEPSEETPVEGPWCNSATLADLNRETSYSVEQKESRTAGWVEEMLGEGATCNAAPLADLDGKTTSAVEDPGCQRTESSEESPVDGCIGGGSHLRNDSLSQWFDFEKASGDDDEVLEPDDDHSVEQNNDYPTGVFPILPGHS